ncbi:MAG: hypothetical protein K2X82_24020 [Gemmataceae bacterium]|nr:hypothetical protein [Gemmataceae bacterium]
MFAHKLLPLLTAAAVAAGVLAVGGRATAQPPRQFGRMGGPYTGFKPAPYFAPNPVFVPKPVFVTRPYFPPVVTPFPAFGYRSSVFAPPYLPPVTPAYPVWGYRPPITTPYWAGSPVIPAAGFGWTPSYWFGW